MIDASATLTIASIAAGGDGVGRTEGVVVFVPRTAPGDVARVRLARAKRFARGELIALEERSPARIEPPCHHYTDDRCGGCQIHVLDRDRFRPCDTAAALLLEFYRADPTRFEWRQPPYEYEHTKMPMDILAGSPALRQQIESQLPLEDIVESWDGRLEEFAEVRARYLLY